MRNVITLELKDIEINTPVWYTNCSVSNSLSRDSSFELFHRLLGSCGHVMSGNAESWKFKHALLQNEEPCRA